MPFMTLISSYSRLAGFNVCFCFVLCLNALHCVSRMPKSKEVLSSTSSSDSDSEADTKVQKLWLTEKMRWDDSAWQRLMVVNGVLCLARPNGRSKWQRSQQRNRRVGSHQRRPAHLKAAEAVAIKKIICSRSGVIKLLLIFSCTCLL